MRRTLRGLRRSVMPSATACRARSALVQWVMCRPLAAGSRQASWTTSARWRGGKPGRATSSLGARQQPLHAGALVAAHGATDGGDAAAQLSGQVADALALGQAQEDAGAADPEPRGGL